MIVVGLMVDGALDFGELPTAINSDAKGVSPWGSICQESVCATLFRSGTCGQVIKSSAVRFVPIILGPIVNRLSIIVRRIPREWRLAVGL